MSKQLLCALAILIASVAPTPAAADIVIGFANPLSGPYAASGGRNRTAVALAIEDLNAGGGVLDQEVRLVEADDACGIEQAVAAARRLIDAGVRFVVGHGCSHSSLMAAGFYEAADVLMISPDSTHPRLTEEGRRNVFRLVGRDDRQGELAGDFLANRWAERRIGIVHDGTVYGQGLAAETRKRLRQLSVVEATYAAYRPGEQDYGRLAERLRGDAIDVLYVGGSGPDAGLIVRTARERGNRLQLVGGDALGMDEFWTVAGKAGEGTIFSSRPAVRWRSDAAAIRTAFGVRRLGPGTGGGIGAYAAVQVWAKAVERAGTTELAAVARALRLGRFNTVLGRVAFDDKGDLRGAGWEMQVWSDGDFRPLDGRTAVTRATDRRPGIALHAPRGARYRRVSTMRAGRCRNMGERLRSLWSTGVRARAPSRFCSFMAGAYRAPPSPSSSIAWLSTTV
jgi:branched-chain amino acid transport system substrate-binding protein